MHLDAYLAETRQLAERQCAVLDQGASRLRDFLLADMPTIS